MAESENEEDLAMEQRLKAAVHYAVGQICEEMGEQEEIKFSKQFISVLAEATFKQAGLFGRDLELFAQHAKRTTITTDDVKLLARRSASLYRHISELQQQQKALNDANKEKRAGKKGKKKTADSTVPPDD